MLNFFVYNSCYKLYNSQIITILISNKILFKIFKFYLNLINNIKVK